MATIAYIILIALVAAVYFLIGYLIGEIKGWQKHEKKIVDLINNLRNGGLEKELDKNEQQTI